MRRWKYDSCASLFRDLALLCRIHISYPILYNPHLESSFLFRKENPVLLRSYLSGLKAFCYDLHDPNPLPPGPRPTEAGSTVLLP